jgi:hypothetical protein
LESNVIGIQNIGHLYPVKSDRSWNTIFRENIFMDPAWEKTSIQRKEREGDLICIEAMGERPQLFR